MPNALQPNARTDLEALLRMANENIACAMGVPASVIFEVNDPRNATNSTGLIDSPNVRVLSLARLTGQILVEQHVTVRCTPFELTACAGSQRRPLLHTGYNF